MSEELTLKRIFLTKLNNTVNPNYVNKMIWAAFALGAMMLSHNIFLDLLLSVNFITESFRLEIELSDSNSKIVFFLGAALVLISLYFFYLTHVNKKQQQKEFGSLQKASSKIRKILEENNRVFKECGPNSSESRRDELRFDLDVWERSKKEIIIPNNDEIYEILSSIKKITSKENIAINAMKSHIEHFKENNVGEGVDYKNHQFPQEFSELIYSFTKPSKKQTVLIKKVSEWITTNSNDLNIESIYIFGSFLYNDNFHDVDVIIKTKDESYEEIKQSSKLWADLKSNFQNEFGFEIHLNVYSEIEFKSFNTFFKKLTNTHKVM